MRGSQWRARADLSGQHWHLVGILGSGMQALACYAAERGIRVSGSDIQGNPALKELMRRGISVRLQQEQARLEPVPDLVVASQAIPDENPELVAARALGVEVLRYPEVLGRLVEAQKSVAVAGVHGKSTTAALVAYILTRAGADPSFLVGAEVPQLGGCAHYGRDELLVVEACEYRRSFLNLWPHIGVVTNVEAEHLDYYHGLWDIEEAFCDFASQVDADGALIINADDPNSRPLAKAASCKVVRFGIDEQKAPVRAERIWRAKKHTNFDLLYRGRRHGRFSIQLYGTHNIYNALAAIAVCKELGLEFEQIREHLAGFTGLKRRLELLGQPWNVAVLSDYAHHPTEIKASLAATRQRFPKRRVFCVFQPHQHSRTRLMLRELAEAFQDAWLTLITDIYAARDSERDRASVSARELVQLMNHMGLTAHYVPEFEDLEEIVVGAVVPGDVVLVLGAGDIWRVAHNVVPRVAEKGRRQVVAA